jgi:predicted dehydrogenase
MKHPQNPFTRRGFIKRAAGSVAAFSVLPGYVAGLARVTSPNNKLNIAAIGAGGHGGSVLNNLASENIVALCDVDSARAANTFNKFPNAKRFQDFRRMFDEMENQIEAVVVATPDHMHGVAVTHAIKRGKHVFCEKPLAHSVYEAREIMRAAREHKVITQLGNQGHSFDSMRVFREWIEDGVIGNVGEVHAICRSVYSRTDMLEAVKTGAPVPETLNWDLWLGRAALRPYHSAYLPGKWRAWSAFGTGVIGDWTCHIVDPVFWALDLGAPATVQAETSDYDPERHGETFPSASTVRFDFPRRGNRPALKLIWHDGANKPPPPEELKEGEELPDIGALVIGEKGKIVHGSHGASRPRVLSDEIMAEVSKEPQRLARSPGHYKEWVESCKTGKPSGSNFDYGGPLTEIALLGAIAIRCKGEKLEWDSEAMKFSNSPRANSFLVPAFREGWAL